MTPEPDEWTALRSRPVDATPAQERERWQKLWALVYVDGVWARSKNDRAYVVAKGLLYASEDRDWSFVGTLSQRYLSAWKQGVSPSGPALVAALVGWDVAELVIGNGEAALTRLLQRPHGLVPGQKSYRYSMIFHLMNALRDPLPEVTFERIRQIVLELEATGDPGKGSAPASASLSTNEGLTERLLWVV
ncbi:hypothetical protein EON81_02235 [bacterium]|nr:MAG: hypothetical protein EON81_02235 [bacterium]